MKKLKLVSLALCAALSLSLASCTLKTPATAATIDGEAIPSGLYLALQLQAYMTASSKVEDSKKVLSGTIDGTPAADWIATETDTALRRYVYIEKEFAAQNLAFTADEEAALTAQIASGYESNAALMKKNGVGDAAYALYYRSETKYQKLLAAYNEKNSESITDKEGMAKMDEIYSRIHNLTLPTTGADNKALDEATLTKITALADKLASEATPENFEEKGTEALKSACKLAGREYTTDLAGQYFAKTFLTETSTSYPAELLKAIRDAKVGTIGQYTLYTSPLVYLKIANYDSEADFKTTYRTSIVGQILTTKYEEEVKTAGAAYKVDIAADAAKAFALKKVDVTI